MITCQYCNQHAKLVRGDVIYPHREDLASLFFWHCAPCDAFVGTHKNSPNHAPLGILANKNLRAMKKRAHAAFDPLWMTKKYMSRSESYKWLAGQLGLTKDECHIGMFNEETCKKVIDTCLFYENRYR